MLSKIKHILILPGMFAIYLVILYLLKTQSIDSIFIDVLAVVSFIITLVSVFILYPLFKRKQKQRWLYFFSVLLYIIVFVSDISSIFYDS